MSKPVNLVHILQSYTHQLKATLGGEMPPPDARIQTQAIMHAELKELRAKNAHYYKWYAVTLLAALVLTVGFALYFKEEMGGLVAVLGAGGVIQGGLLVRMSDELKEKTRVETVAVLAASLPPEQLLPVLQDLLTGMRSKPGDVQNLR